MKKLLIAIGIIIAALIIFAAGYFIMMKTVISKMTTAETGKITGNVYAIKDSFVNAYIISSDRCVTWLMTNICLPVMF